MCSIFSSSHESNVQDRDHFSQIRILEKMTMPHPDSEYRSGFWFWLQFQTWNLNTDPNTEYRSEFWIQIRILNTYPDSEYISGFLIHIRIRILNAVPDSEYKSVSRFELPIRILNGDLDLKNSKYSVIHRYFPVWFGIHLIFLFRVLAKNEQSNSRMLALSSRVWLLGTWLGT